MEEEASKFEEWADRLGGSAGGRFGLADDVMRVNQLDAQQLDSELHMMLGSQLGAVFEHVRPGLAGRFKPELDAVLRALVFRYSVAADVPSPGLALQNLRYRNAAARHDSYRLLPRQKVAHFMLDVFARWAWTRLDAAAVGGGWSARGDWRRPAYRAMRAAEKVYRAAMVANFVAFLVTGRYRSLVDRLLRTRLVYNHSRVGRQVTFDYLNQQLIWHGFSEFLLFFLPFVDFERLRALGAGLVRAALPASITGAGRGEGGGGGSADAGADGEGEGAGRRGPCPVCEADPIVVPFRAPCCGRHYCYYCLEGSRAAEPAYRCAACGARVTGAAARVV